MSAYRTRTIAFVITETHYADEKRPSYRGTAVLPDGSTVGSSNLLRLEDIRLMLERELATFAKVSP